MKQKFELTITNQKRAITSLLLFPLSIILSIFIGSLLNFTIGILFFLFFIYLLWYFVIGNLIITIEDEILNFEWRKKLIFNYKKINSFNQSEIDKVIVDRGLFLRKIIIGNREIEISTSTIKPKDASKLISYFNNLSKTEKSPSIKNSWENYSKRKLKIFYTLNWIFLLSALILFVITAITKEFNLKLLFILGPIFMLILYGQQIKNTIKKKDRESNSN